MVKLLSIFVCFLLICSMCRVAMGSGPLRINDVLVVLSDYEIGFEEVTDFFDTLSKDIENMKLYQWNDDLGFWDNLALFFVSLGNLIYTFTVELALTFFSVIIDIARMVFQLVKIIGYMLGFYVPTN